ncbi:MAG: tetratricopeptide repeat protein [Planctomycetaceae bacterium]|jgi:tetratricopeptide (TPR) repeat protein|nr:tetratricopeptide repeat protein [Planctomycetaceae bacterium]
MNQTKNQTVKNQFPTFTFLHMFFQPNSMFRIGVFLLSAIIFGNCIAIAQTNPIRGGTPPTPNNVTPNNIATNNVETITPNKENNITDPVVKAELEKAVEAFNKSKFPETLDILKTLCANHPEIAPPRVIMAQMFAEAKLGDAVRANLELGTEETPDDPEAYLLLGEIALRQRSLTAAELLLKRAAEKVQAYSANATRKKNLTSSLMRVFSDLYEVRQRWEQMEKCVNEQIQFDGQNATFLRRKGIAVFRQNRDDEAKQLFLQADQLDKENKEFGQKGLPADAAMSQLYLTRNDKDNARKSLEAALKAYPQSKEVLALSVQMRINDDQLEDAGNLSQKLLNDDQTSIPAKRLRATVALYLQDYPLAEKLFQELLLESPTDSQAQNGLALALCEQQNSPDKIKRALEYAVDNVRKNQNNSEFWGTLGWVQYQANMFDEATKSLRQSVATGSINAATAYYHARLAVKANKIDDAKQFLNLALQGNNQFAKRREAIQMQKELSK